MPKGRRIYSPGEEIMSYNCPCSDNVKMFKSVTCLKLYKRLHDKKCTISRNNYLLRHNLEVNPDVDYIQLVRKQLVD